MTRPTPAGVPGLTSNSPYLQQAAFPDQTRELGTDLALYDQEILVLRGSQVDSAGATRWTYTPDAEPIVGRVDPVGGARSGLRSAMIDESSTHVFRILDNSVTTADRFRWDNRDWIITASRRVSDALVWAYEAKAV